MVTKTEDTDTDARQATILEFKVAVNLSAGQIERWLDTEESKAVGQKQGGTGETTDFAMGRKIADLLAKKQRNYGDDLAKMRKGAGYTERHLAQRPDGDATHISWRRSFITWGHAPLMMDGRFAVAVSARTLE